MRPLALLPVGTTVGSLASAGAKALSRSTAGSGSTGASDSSSVSQQVRCVLRVFVHKDVLSLGVHRHQLRGHGLDSFGLPEETVVLVFRTHTMTGFNPNCSYDLKHGTPTMPQLFHFGTSRCLSFFFLHLYACSFTRCRGLTFMLARVLVPSTCR